MSPKKSKVAYILFNLSNLKDEINPSMDEVDIEYQDYLEAFDTSERKSVSHIMLNITEARSSEVAMMEMDKIKQQISEGANFNDLILKYTEDEASKNIKGSIGVTDGTLFPPEFEDTLLTMDAGEISKPIELETSVHLLRLDEIIQPKPLSREEKLNDFNEEIRLRQAEDNYITLIDKASDLVFSSSSIQDIAGDFKQVLNETDLFTEFDIPEDLNHQSVIDFIFTENLEGNFPEVIEISTELAVLIQVVNFEDTAQLSLDSAREQIRVAYIEEEGLRKSQEFVNTANNDLSNDKSLKAL
jgi:peptidyl-prolyl cis-trans isomerase D